MGKNYRLAVAFTSYALAGTALALPFSAQTAELTLSQVPLVLDGSSLFIDVAEQNASFLTEDPGSIAGGIWYPGRDQDGNVTPSSFALLPLDEWVQVNGTQLQGLVDVLTDAGWDPATNEWSGAQMLSINRGYGGCVNVGGQIMYPWIGGHGDGSFNGIARFDTAKMAWAVEAMPSDPYAVGYEWPAVYDVPGGSGLPGYTGTFTNYPEATAHDDAFDVSTYRDILPDGHPTSRHTYYTPFYDSTRDEIGTGALASQWVYNRGTGTFTRRRWTQAGVTKYVGIWGHLYYHAGQDALYGHLSIGGDLDVYSWLKIAAGGGVMTSKSAGGYFSGRGAWSLRLDDDRILWTCYNDDIGTPAEYWGIYNMATETGTGGAVINGYGSGQWTEMPVAALVPTWGTEGQVIVRDSRGWSVFDINTKTKSAYTPAGNPPTFDLGNNPPGNKTLHVPEIGCVLALQYVANYSTPAIYVMRYE